MNTLINQKQNTYYPKVISKAFELLEESEILQKGKALLLPFELPVTHLSSFFLAPLVLGGRALFNFFRAALYGLALPISCLSSICTLGFSKVARDFTAECFIKLLQCTGEGILDITTLIFAEGVYLAGVFIHPKIPQLIEEKR